MFENITYPEMWNEFYTKYHTQIVPCVRKYDQERKNKLILASILSTFFALAGVLIIILVKLDGGTGEDAFTPASFLFGSSYFAWFVIKKNFERKIKNKIMRTVCSCFEKLTWSKSRYIGGKVFEKSGVVPHFTSEIYDDIFAGFHKGVHMEIVESEFKVRRGKYEGTVFKGVVIKLDMNKAFTSHTIIAPDSYFHKSPVHDLRHTVLEDVEFEKKFDVYTNDEVDARYLITPAFMQRLIDLKTAFYADKIQCAFFENFLIISLNTSKDLFSLCSLLKPIDDNRQYFEMFEEIISIIKLIDHFKLNEKTGL